MTSAVRTDRLPRSAASNYFRAETVIFLFIWLTLMVVGRSRFFLDPGSLWHPVVGKMILDTGHLIYADSFSFTRQGQPWIDQWWLADVLLALLHAIGGLDTILLATAATIAALYTWIAHRLIARGLHPLLAALVISLACVASTYHFHPRPHLATIAFMAVTFAWLCDFEAGRISVCRLFWLVPLFILWTNIHGGMIGGVATLGLAFLGWSVSWLAGLESPIKRWAQVFLLGGLVTACALTALINPYGLDLPRAWFQLILSPVLPKLIMEHQPLMTTNTGYTVVVFAALYAAAFFGVLPNRPRITWLLPLIWFCLAWTRIRHGPICAVTAAIALADMLPHIGWLAWLSRHGSITARLRLPVPETGSIAMCLRPALVPGMLILLALILQSSRISFPLLGAGRAHPNVEDSPYGLLPELQSLVRSRPPGTKIFNDMFYAGFVIYYTPEFRVFIDDRCELYGDEELLTYAHAMNEDPAQLDVWQKQYGFDLALTIAGSNFDRYLQEQPSNWEEIRRTTATTLYRRRVP